MVVTKIGQEFTLNIPDQFRQKFTPGQEVAVSTDAQGRLVVTPIEQVRALLMETFGMWADRTDVPADSLDYVDDIRRGRRLDEIDLRSNEAD